MELLLKILLIFFLVLLNGFFVAAEFSLVALRKTRTDELVKKGHRLAKLVQKAQKNLNRYMSSAQLGITLTSLGLGWIGEPTLAQLIEPMLTFLPKHIAFISSHTISILLAFMAITYLHIVLGEVAPKTVAIQAAEKTSFFIITPLVIFTKFFAPFIGLLNISGTAIVKVLGFDPKASEHLVHSEEEIKLIVSQSHAGGAIEREEMAMLFNVFKLSDLTVKQIMTPRSEIVAFSIHDSLRKFNQIIKKYPYHSRFPVYKKNSDSIIGFIHIKDIYKIHHHTSLTIYESGIIRKILNVSENKKLDDVFVLMRKKRIHIAVVADRDGKTTGIVAMEDILESLVGEIEDEFDNPVLV